MTHAKVVGPNKQSSAISHPCSLAEGAQIGTAKPVVQPVRPCCVFVCLVCSPLCLQYQVGESCAYVNTSRTPRDTRNSMQVHLVRGAKRQETAQSARGI